jgi:MFS family permease
MFSWFGGLIQQVAAAWLMVSLSSSHQMVALVQASSTIPIMLLALFVGAIADSYDRRLVMLIAQSGMFVVSTALAVMTYVGALTPALLLTMTFLVGVGTTLNGPAWQASLRMQVPPEDIPAAVSLNSISFNLARSVGPAIGGLLISLAGPALNFTVNALSYVGIIVVLWRWRPGQVELRREPMMAAISRGLTFCRTTPAIRATLVRSTVFGIGGAALQSLMPLVAKEQLNGDQFTYGLLLGSFGVGSIVAALVVGKVRRAIGNDGAVAGGSVAFALGSFAAAWSPSLALTLPFTFMAGMGWVSVLTSCNVSVQMRAPDDIAGRCISIYHMCTFGGMAIGAWSWGALSDRVGIQSTLSIAGTYLLLTPLLRFAIRVPEPSD